jgi:hypothetical protein
MSSEEKEPRPTPRPAERKLGTDEKVGRTLGKAFGRLKRTKVWRDTAKAYQEGLDGKR